jgi:Zn-dependent protease/predicted transcriptional regulator
MPASRRGVVELFKVAGVQIEIDFSWIVIFVLVFWSLSAGYFPLEYPGRSARDYWLVGFAATILFFSSVLAHELSHAALANRLGEKVTRITLFIFGGMAHLSGEPKSAASEFKIAAIGPASSIAIAGLFWFVAQAVRPVAGAALWAAMFRYLALINLVLAVFNLLPGFPLDGGRLLRAFLWQRSGNFRRATARAADWGSGIAWALIAIGTLEIFEGGLIGGLWLIFIGLFLRSAATMSYQSVVIEQMLGEVRVEDLMIRDPISVAPDLKISDAVERFFLHYGYTGLPVVEDGRALGLLSLGRVRECPAAERSARTVRDVMVPIGPNITISPDASISDALHQMAEADAGRLLVMDGDRLVGLITRSTIARFVQIRAQLTGPAPSAA